MITAKPLDTPAIALDTPHGDRTHVRDGRIASPMFPGGREPGLLTTFGPPPRPDSSPIAMDATTIAARQREGGGAPNQRQAPHDGSLWTRLTRFLRRQG